jgi:hypothetical protein
MDRLTSRKYGEISFTGRINPYSPYCSGCINKDCDCGIVEDMVKKLADYEDLEEQGGLVKLPCKVGDVVYFAHHDRVISSEVLSAKYHAEAENHGVFIRERLTIDVEGVSAGIDFGDIGKRVFLTKSEAEAKLKELRGVE